MDITNISAQQLRRAADIQEKIQSLQDELGRILGAAVEPPPTAEPASGKRRMSAAGRARIAAAAKARWAKLRKQKGATAPAGEAAQPKRKMSAAARKKLAALAKARWAKAKAAGKAKL